MKLLALRGSRSSRPGLALRLLHWLPPLGPMLLGTLAAAQGSQDADVAMRAALALSASPTEVKFDRPAGEGPLWALGASWKASFDERGATFVPFFGSEAPRNFPLAISLATATLDGAPLPLRTARPEQRGMAVTYDRGALTEVIETRLAAIEQSFVFAALPHRGTLRVEVRIATELQPRADADGLTFVNDFGSVRYHKAVAVDAAGRRQDLRIDWRAGVASIEIPAAFVAAAELPLVLDPVVQTNTAVFAAGSAVQSAQDVATLPGDGRTCVVLQRRFSSNDMDMFAALLDANLAVVPPILTIDFTGTSWAAPAVAGSAFAHGFLVVASRGTGAANTIGGRLVGASGSVGPVLDIAAPPIGSTSSLKVPDVGADPYFSINSYFTVVWESSDSISESDIWYRQLTQTGAPRTAAAIRLTQAPGREWFPSISKSCGRVGAFPTQWNVAWMADGAGGSDIYGAQIAWSGGIARGPYPIDTSTNDDSLPDASSWADIDGARVGLVAYQRGPSGASDIVCAAVDTFGSVLARTNLSALVFGGARRTLDQSEAEVDSDGVRFVVTYGESTTDVRAAVVTYQPLIAGFRVDDDQLVVAATPSREREGYVAADFSGGGSASARYVAIATNVDDNSVRAVTILGHRPTTPFATRATACGSLPISVSGIPALGCTVNMQVPNTGTSGLMIGSPGAMFVFGCSCIYGVANASFYPPNYSMVIPASSAMVGVVLSVQGYTSSGICLGQSLSNTIDITIQ